MDEQWVEYDVYEVLPDGSLEPYSGTFMTYEEARLEYDVLMETQTNKQFVLVQGDFKVVKRNKDERPADS